MSTHAPAQQAADQGRQHLTRKEAADYLTKRWFRCSIGSLARYATKGIGPVYLVRGGGGESLYTRPDLDSWAQGFMQRPAPHRPSRLEQPAAPKVKMGALATALAR